MKAFYILRRMTLLIMSAILASSCSKSQFEQDECLTTNKENSPISIIKIVSVAGEKVIYFSYFLSDGKLILAEDYQEKNLAELQRTHVKIKCPNANEVFSPDKYLSKP
jgi:hypothetical protein